MGSISKRYYCYLFVSKYEIHFLWRLITYHVHPFVKHVLAFQNDFGMPKITWSNHKSFGFEETPPPLVGKNSQIILYFFWRVSLMVKGIKMPFSCTFCHCPSEPFLSICNSTFSLGHLPPQMYMSEYWQKVNIFGGRGESFQIWKKLLQIVCIIK